MPTSPPTEETARPSPTIQPHDMLASGPMAPDQEPPSRSGPTSLTLSPAPDLVLLTNLLSRLLAQLEEPSGELDTALAQVLTQLSALAGTMAKAAQALEAATGPEGALGRLESELAAIREEQVEQRTHIQALAAETTMLVNWLAKPLREEKAGSLGASE